MKAGKVIILFATILGFVCCQPEVVKPKPPKSGDDDNNKGTATFTFSAATSKYASLKETVFLKVDNPDKITVAVDWGDGSKDSGSGTEFSHKYTKAGKYKVKAGSSSSPEEWEIEIGSLLALDEAVKELYNTPGKVWVRPIVLILRIAVFPRIPSRLSGLQSRPVLM